MVIRWLRHVGIGLLCFYLILAFPTQVMAGSFSAENAYEHIKYLVQTVGPRVAGSDGEEKTIQYLYYILQKHGWKVKEQPFTKIVLNPNPFDFEDYRIKIINSKNIIAELPGEKTDSIIIGAHYDTAGHDVPGAVDNASGVGTVLELARVLAQETRKFSYQIVFFGAEEYGLVGSQYYASHTDLSAVNWMLNIDMVGEPLEIDIAGSKTAPPELLSAAAEVAGKHKIPFHLSRDFIVMAREFENSGASDFSSFLRQGIPALGISIAGRPGGYFHRPEDQLHQISMSSLQKIGNYVEDLVTSVELEQSGPRVWDELYIPFQIGGHVLIIPSWIWRILLVMIVALAISLLVKVMRQKWRERRLEVFTAFLLAVMVCLIAVGFSSIGEILWQKVKGITVLWNSFPEAFVVYRLSVIGTILVIGSLIITQLTFVKNPKAYWLLGYLCLFLGLLLCALIRIDLALPLAFWTLTYSLLLRYPSIILTVLGPYFIYCWHWEMLNSQQWQHFYHFAHKYSLLFIIGYAFLIVPLLLSLLYVIASKKRLAKYPLKRVVGFLLAVIGVATLVLGLIPSYTSQYPQLITVSEHFRENGENTITISSPDHLSPSIVNHVLGTPAKNLKEISIPNRNAQSPVKVKATVSSSDPHTRNVALRFAYDREPSTVSITLDSHRPFKIVALENFLPVEKLPRNIELKGKKVGNKYTVTIERHPPHHPAVNLVVEAEDAIEATLECTLTNNHFKLNVEAERASVSYETIYEMKFEI